MNPGKKLARVAGVLYLMVIVFGIGSEMIRSSLVVRGDAVTTANNILASEALFRMGFVSDLIMMTSFLFLALALYVLLKPVNKNYATIMVLFVAVSIPTNMINLLNHFSALLLLGGADYLTVFNAAQLQAQAMLHLEMYQYGYHIAQIFFGLWLLPLGVLVYQSGYFPKILGILLVIATFGHLIELLTLFLLPNYEVITYPGMAVAVVAEFAICGWLLIKGANVPQPAASQPAYAGQTI